MLVLRKAFLSIFFLNDELENKICKYSVFINFILKI
jgi:hypothetical protein